MGMKAFRNSPLRKREIVSLLFCRIHEMTYYTRTAFENKPIIHSNLYATS